MINYTDKESLIVNQCHKGPFHTLVTKLSNEEFDELVNKLMMNDDSYALISLIAIYRDFNRNKIIMYFINKGNLDELLSFLDYCYDFEGYNNPLDQTFIVDQLIKKNDINFIKELLASNNLYFLTNKKEKERLEKFSN